MRKQGVKMKEGNMGVMEEEEHRGTQRRGLRCGRE